MAMILDLLRTIYYGLHARLASLRPTRDRRRPPWAWVHNRLDDLAPGPGGLGVHCAWDGSRHLWYYNRQPQASTGLIERMLSDWPMGLADLGVEAACTSDAPDVSVIIPHRGTARVEHLLAVLRSFAMQRGVTLEVIVVEQDHDSTIGSRLPVWVRHLEDKIPPDEIRFNRARALNVGAAQARGELLLLHDGDMLVPRDYARELLDRSRGGFDVINTKRFIAYLSESSTRRVFACGGLYDLQAEQIVENLRAGGSIAITRSAYAVIGGMDSGFVGWGGEDEEFWDRCQELLVFDAGYMPILHLWHPAQPGKNAVGGRGEHTADYYAERMAVPRSDRIAALRAYRWGSVGAERERMTDVVGEAGA